MTKFVSNAEWPLNVYRGIDGTGITSDDSHRTREEAQAVCNALDYSGFGGMGKHFPIRTWVTEK